MQTTTIIRIQKTRASTSKRVRSCSSMKQAWLTTTARCWRSTRLSLTLKMPLRSLTSQRTEISETNFKTNSIMSTWASSKSFRRAVWEGSSKWQIFQKLTQRSKINLSHQTQSKVKQLGLEKRKRKLRQLLTKRRELHRLMKIQTLSISQSPTPLTLTSTKWLLTASTSLCKTRVS